MKANIKFNWYNKEVFVAIENIISDVEEEAADSVMKTAIVLCPESVKEKNDKYGNKKGTLKKSIRKYKSTHGGYIVMAGGKGAWGDAYYASFVELGTPSQTYKSGKKKGKARTPVPPRKFLRNALKKNRKNILQKFKGALS